MVDLNQLIAQYKLIYSQYLIKQEIYEIELYVIASFPLIIFIIYYFFKGSFQKYYYLLWFKLNRNKRITSIKSSKDSLGKGVVLGLIVMLLIFSFGVYVLNTQSKESFSEMLLLNSNGTIGNYPSNLVPGEIGLVYVEVQNHEGKPMLYEIKVILEENTTNSTLYTIFNIVNNDGVWKAPINFSINSTGIFKIVICLYYYNITVQNFVYTNIFDQLVVSVR
ncbi:DUF1616 domain-containing protein [Sulfolobus tengchongensis]|uniref:DUF1616 domain-containing protein n=1 Tax=Sulfolobus tengchongensis TaxID=207809 RepID=A0AAX4L274_9CREN